MKLSDIITKCFILALIIRDDGERLLLGDGFYEFKEQLQHFAPNIYQNDVIELQGTDGQLLAGQVRRGATQSFDGYIADPTISREATEQHRQRFLGFFRKKHHYKVVYVFPDGTAIKRERGYIVDAPAVQEMFQRFPEYHVGLNFEDVNYYEYEEGEDGDEIYAHVQSIAINGYIEGGLVWDNLGAVTNSVTWVDYALKTTTDGYAQITDGYAGAPLNLEQLLGNTTQIQLDGRNLLDESTNLYHGFYGSTNPALMTEDESYRTAIIDNLPAGTYTISCDLPTCFMLRWAINNTNTFIQSTISTYTFTTTESGKLKICFRKNPASTITESFHTQIEKGSTAHDWQEYVGGEPSPNPDFPQVVNIVTGLQTVKIVGKNLFDKDGVSPINAYVTMDGKIGASGVDRLVCVPVMPNTTYTITADRVGQVSGQPSDDFAGALFTSVAAPTVGSEGRRIFGTSAATYPRLNQTFTTSATENWLAIKVASVQRSDYAGSLATIQLEISPTATEFEAFSSNEFEINLGGVNLVKSSDIHNGSFLTYAQISDNDYTETGNHKYRSIRIESLPAGTYTLSINWKETAMARILCQATGGAVSDIGRDANTFTFTTASEGLFGITFRKTNSTEFTDDDFTIQIEKGSQATPYQPWAPYVYELTKIDTYRDAFKYVDGVWYKHTEIRKIIFDGTESWAFNGNQRLFVHTYLPANGKFRAQPLILSDNFTAQNFDRMYDATFPSGISLGSTASYNDRICIRYADITSVENFKTWLGTHNTIVYYVLDTPTDTQITDQELIQQLSTIKNFVGATDNIWLIPSAGAQGEMEVRYSRGFINQGAGYVWDVPSGAGPNVVSVDGIDRTGIVWEVVGPATNPTLTNITTNQTMEFEGDIAAGQTLTVNTTDQTATIEGTNVFAQMTGDWLELAAGNNIITYTATGTTDSSTIKWNGVIG